LLVALMVVGLLVAWALITAGAIGALKATGGSARRDRECSWRPLVIR
jgi:hypothetical protein